MLINIQIIYTTQSQHLEVACLNYRISNIRWVLIIIFLTLFKTVLKTEDLNPIICFKMYMKLICHLRLCKIGRQLFPGVKLWLPRRRSWYSVQQHTHDMVSLKTSQWWRHQMETFSALVAICVENSPVTGEFSAQMPVTWSFDVFFDVCLNKRLSKQSWGWWFETALGPLWRHSNGCFNGPAAGILYLPWISQIPNFKSAI